LKNKDNKFKYYLQQIKDVRSYRNVKLKIFNGVKEEGVKYVYKNKVDIDFPVERLNKKDITEQMCLDSLF